MSIRLQLLFVTALTAILLTIQVVLSFMSAIEARRSADETIQAQALQDLALGVTQGFAIDRGQTNGVASGLQLSPEALDKLTAIRKQSLADLDSLLTEAGGNDTSQVKVAVAQASDIRGRIHGSLPEAKEERRALARDWFAAETKAIEAVDSLASTMVAQDDHMASSLLVRAAEARHQIWEIAEFLGRERGLVNGLLASQSVPTTEQLMRLAEYRGHVVSAWTAARPKVEQLGADMSAPLAAAEDALSGSFDEVRQTAYGAFLAGKAPAMSAQDWFAAASKAIDSVGALQKAVGGHVAAMMEAQRSAANGEFIWAFVLLAGALGATALTLAIAHWGITSPLTRLTGITRALTAGQLDVAIATTGRRDEIGHLFRSVIDFRSALVEAARLREERARLEREAEEEKIRNMLKLADGLEATVGTVAAALGTASQQLESAANTLSAGAEETSNQSMAVVRAADFAQQGTQSAAGAAEELASSVKEIGRQVEASSEAAKSAVRLADDTAKKVLGLAHTAQQIETVVALIADIAARTNLLALNATIEAARAGEAGKGFAVVASEVKQLAAQTEKATAEISSQATQIQTATKASSEAIETIATRVRDIGATAAAIAAAVTEQEAATAEVARSISMAADAASEVGGSIFGVAEAASETSRTSSEVHDSASSLSGLVGQLKQEVANVVVGLRG
ncbi:methyl-accepting chemotaxis protein [Pleomorphomonas oryzae]|uniref:methyl-accepting chemotaxis protein n=1 Tax=Pleomorphomonas oryzae TaxID=261934 RepID=UPI0003FBAE30|nr:HAMP domain-containing methyl-accepting chemotaxis protein [Pleomorphomonas oryzae]